MKRQPHARANGCYSRRLIQVWPNLTQMKTSLLVAAFVVFCGHAAAAAPKEERPVVMPINGTAQKLSQRMAEELARLRDQAAFLQLESWTRLSEMPAWVAERKDAPEQVSLRASVIANDMFNHTVIIAKNHETLVIRTGGFAGVYQIYQEPKRPNPAPEPR
jgi:hypothetical protein